MQEILPNSKRIEYKLMYVQQPDPTFELPKEGVSVSELKRVIELLPLETSAVNAVAPRLAMLDPKQFAALLTELARDNHAFRSAYLPLFCDDTAARQVLTQWECRICLNFRCQMSSLFPRPCVLSKPICVSTHAKIPW